LCACSGGESRPGTATPGAAAATAKVDATSADTLVVNTRAAVFYTPDSAKIEKEKALNEDDFYTAADDAAWYMYQSRQYMDSVKVRSVDLVNHRFIRFIRSNGTASYVCTDTLNDLWGVFLFDPAKAPAKGDIVDIEASYKNYF
jgi:hypothetical protein